MSLIGEEVGHVPVATTTYVGESEKTCKLLNSKQTIEIYPPFTTTSLQYEIGDSMTGESVHRGRWAYHMRFMVRGEDQVQGVA